MKIKKDFNPVLFLQNYVIIYEIDVNYPNKLYFVSILPTITRLMNKAAGMNWSPYEQPITKVKNIVPKNSEITFVVAENFYSSS